MRFEITELLPIVKELTEKYTSKASTSVSYEAAQQLMGAALYCIEEAERENGDGDDITNMLVNPKSQMTAKEAYERGHAIVVQKTVRAQEHYSELIVDFKGYGNRAYHYSVTKSLPEFFKWYDTKFCPQDHRITLDYPLLISHQTQQGINLIDEYIRCIVTEQKFLSKMQEDFIVQVLTEDDFQYRDSLTNICRVVLKKLLINLLIEVPINQVKVCVQDYEKIKTLIDELGEEGLLNRINGLLKLLINKVYEGDVEMQKYLENCTKGIVSELIDGAENNYLKSII